MNKICYYVGLFIRGMCLGISGLILILSIVGWFISGVLDQTFLDRGVILLLLGLAHGPEKYE